MSFFILPVIFVPLSLYLFPHICKIILIYAAVFSRINSLNYFVRLENKW